MDNWEFIKTHPEFGSLVAAQGWEGAEASIRGKTDATSRQLVSELDAARAEMRQKQEAHNTGMAKRLGLSLDQCRELVARLAGDAALWTWLGRRVQHTTLHDRPLEHHE